MVGRADEGAARGLADGGGSAAGRTVMADANRAIADILAQGPVIPVIRPPGAASAMPAPQSMHWSKIRREQRAPRSMMLLV
jgi:hypothetical protein